MASIVPSLAVHSPKSAEGLNESKIKVRRTFRKTKVGGEISSASMRKADRVPTGHSSKTKISLGAKIKFVTVSILQYAIFAGVGIAVVFDRNLGQLLIGFLTVLALVIRIPYKMAFGSALFLLVTIPLFLLLQRPQVAYTLAIYAYELLSIGVIMSIIQRPREVS